MGKKWDNGEAAFAVEFWAEVYRVLKPGGHVLAFGGTRTYHRLACAVEDAGFEIRDQIGWVYGSGFPKSSNQHGDWEGWGTALKPAWEPIVVARKPLIGTVAANLNEHGTGALNIDGCRVPTGDDLNGGAYSNGSKVMAEATSYATGNGLTDFVQPLGRWPANIIHDGSDEVLAAFPDTGVSSGGRTGNAGGGDVQNVPTGAYQAGDPGFGDSGSAARFFKSAEYLPRMIFDGTPSLRTLRKALSTCKATADFTTHRRLMRTIGSAQSIRPSSRST